jgi:hypothetical protein
VTPVGTEMFRAWTATLLDLLVALQVDSEESASATQGSATDIVLRDAHQRLHVEITEHADGRLTVDVAPILAAAFSPLAFMAKLLAVETSYELEAVVARLREQLSA